MEVSDKTLWTNRDWNPVYLSNIFSQDFYEFNDLWTSSVRDSDLVSHVESVERYNPIVEDISMDDETLCSAVEEIEEQ